MASRVLVRPKSLSSWQYSCIKLAPRKEAQCEGRGDDLIGGYFAPDCQEDRLLGRTSKARGRQPLKWECKPFRSRTPLGKWAAYHARLCVTVSADHWYALFLVKGTNRDKRYGGLQLEGRESEVHHLPCTVRDIIVVLGHSRMTMST